MCYIITMKYFYKIKSGDRLIASFPPILGVRGYVVVNRIFIAEDYHTNQYPGYPQKFAVKLLGSEELAWYSTEFIRDIL